MTDKNHIQRKPELLFWVNGFLIFQLLLESFGNKSSYVGNWLSTKIGSGVWFCWDLEDSAKFLGELAKIVGILVWLTKGTGVFIEILCAVLKVLVKQAAGRHFIMIFICIQPKSVSNRDDHAFNEWTDAWTNDWTNNWNNNCLLEALVS